jgi:hypothetical protein
MICMVIMSANSFSIKEGSLITNWMDKEHKQAKIIVFMEITKIIWKFEEHIHGVSIVKVLWEKATIKSINSTINIEEI